jgi:glucose-6-phosphate isomerase
MPKTAEHLGPLSQPVEQRLAMLDRDEFGKRLWAKDPALWKSDSASKAAIANRLGWLDVVETMRKAEADLIEFREQTRKDNIHHVLLLGMGGSSLAPEMLAKTFGTAADFLDLRILDSTDPAAVRDADAGFEPAKTLYIVSSKSGTTTEPDSFYRHFWEKSPDGKHFVAITDPGSPLSKLAAEKGFRRVFTNPADIGGRYSALSLFGLVPAALLGLDLDRLLKSAVRMAAACGPTVKAADNPGLRLGAILGQGPALGRDKLTLLLSRELHAFGGWIEQLVAESTGKEGRGVIPIDGEPAGAPSVYGKDRLFVYIRLEGTRDTELDEKVAALEKADHPVIRIELKDLYELGGEFLKWEIATAVAGSVLGINPFDEPNVSESKELTRDLLGTFQKAGKLPEDPPAAEGDGMKLWADPDLKPGAGRGVVDWLEAHLARAGAMDFVALLAYLPPTQKAARDLEAMRSAVRDRTRRATTVGFGPRFLHSIGQLYKGGPNCGLFIQITCDDAQDAAIPGEKYGFSILKQAQAAGDFLALKRHKRRAVRVHLAGDPAAGLDKLRREVERIVSGARARA